ncbi:arylesterase [Undibacter mobilis]|uniref:Arylesterase n=1 Tax=Undibacter mobilis TaxID=2292256 RepID=A0A371BDQ8_9BRAD|nr:arylesterase [Undibacter mobilis]RDV05729.1 arylesterase [Undibacter mobilis]
MRWPTYGEVLGPVQRAAALLLTIVCVLGPNWAAAADKPVKIVVLGDSLTAGYGLNVQDAFPTKLGVALKAKGHAIELINAGVSGDTATGGLDRFDWSVPADADALILELGANDALRGVSPDVTRAALDKILSKAAERKIPVLIAGMKSPPNMGADYVAKFDAIFPELARTHNALLYPFFLEGVAADEKLNQRDGMHPNSDGVDVIVKNILPKVEELIAKAKAS